MQQNKDRKLVDLELHREYYFGPEGLIKLITIILSRLPSIPIHKIKYSGCSKLHAVKIVLTGSVSKWLFIATRMS